MRRLRREAVLVHVPMTRAFDSIDWKNVAQLLGARVSKLRPSSVYLVMPSRQGDVTSPLMTLLISDNAGEVNVSEVKPQMWASVPLPGDDFREPHEAMAHRLHCAIYGHDTDYEFGRKHDD
jgi:hypothetical protein